MILIREVFGVLFLLALLVVYVRFVEKATVFQPGRTLARSPRDLGLSYEDVRFSSIDNVKLHGWLIQSPEALGTMIFLHGNAGNIGDRLEKIALFNRLGINVFIIDYRGYGLSGGHPTEKGLYLDALAAYDYLRHRNDIMTERIFVYGCSLGGAVAVDLASNRPVKALILDSTFSSAGDMAKKIMPWVPRAILSCRFDNMSKVKGLQIPKLFIHSEHDEIVPYAFSRKLYDAAATPKSFVKVAGGHNDNFIISQNLYVDGIWNFLKRTGLVWSDATQ